jgi:hypothetical protein
MGYAWLRLNSTTLSDHSKMKQLLQDKDYVKIGYYKSILEENGIPALQKNEHLSGLFGDLPLPVFHPSFHVNDEDYEMALEILQKYEECYKKE